MDPCIPVPANAPPQGEQWQHEPQFDGWRCQAVKSGRDVRLFTRRGLDMTEGAAALVEMLAELPAKRFVLDGELISSNPEGVPDFASLSRAMRRNSRALIFAAFDCLHLDARDLRRLALEDRRRTLVHLIANSQVPVMVIPASTTERYSSANVSGPDLRVWCRNVAIYLTGPAGVPNGSNANARLGRSSIRTAARSAKRASAVMAAIDAGDPAPRRRL